MNNADDEKELREWACSEWVAYMNPNITVGESGALYAEARPSFVAGAEHEAAHCHAEFRPFVEIVAARRCYDKKRCLAGDPCEACQARTLLNKMRAPSPAKLREIEQKAVEDGRKGLGQPLILPVYSQEELDAEREQAYADGKASVLPGAIGKPCSRCSTGKLMVYDVEGAPPGAYPGNYVCDNDDCDAVTQVYAETNGGLAAAKERCTCGTRLHQGHREGCPRYIDVETLSKPGEGNGNQGSLPGAGSIPATSSGALNPSNRAREIAGDVEVLARTIIISMRLDASIEAHERVVMARRALANQLTSAFAEQVESGQHE